MSPSTEGEVRIAPIALATAPLAGVVLATVITGVVGPVLANAAVGVGILLVCALIGIPAVRWLGLPETSLVERGVMAAALGTGVVGVGLGTLGVLEWLHPVAAAGLPLTGAAVAAAGTRPWRRAPGLADELYALAAGPVALTLLAAAAIVFGIVLSASVVPPWDWDSLMYHLSLPAEFLDRQSITFDPVNVHQGYVGAVHMLYVMAAVTGVPQAATVVSGMFGILLALFVFRTALREMGKTAAGAAVAGVAGSTIVALVAITPRVDATLALFLFLAHLSILRLARGGSSRFLIAAGAFGGVALATKLHAGAYLVPLGVWGLWIALRYRLNARVVAFALLAGTALAAPWIARNVMLFEDPFFPLISGTGIPPWLRSDQNVVETASSVAGGVLGMSRNPVTLQALLFEPWLLSPEAEARYYLWSPILLVGFVFLLFSRSAWRWAAPAIVYLAIVLSRSLRTNLRYLIPAIPALAIGAAGAADALLASRPKLSRWAIGTLWLASLAPLAVPVVLVSNWIRNPVESGRYDTIYAIAASASEIVPTNGAILMLYEARGHPFDRPVIQDNRALTWPLLYASGHAANCLADLPVTHVLINTGALGMYQQRAGGLQHVSDGSLERFAQRCLVVEVERGPHVLFRIQPRPV